MAAAPLGADAAIVSMVGLDKSLAQGESYSLPGIPDITFKWDPTLKIDTANGALFGSNVFGHLGFVGAEVSVGGGAGDYRPSVSHAAFGEAFSTKPGEGFLGIQFMRATEVHYGWVELTITGLPAQPGVTIHGFGYEDVPRASIATGATAVPEPNMLALAAAGTLAALGVGRRRRRTTAH